MINKDLERVLVFGTFDIIHKGHMNFFVQARALSKTPFLIVSVARGKNVAKIKGVLPKNSQQVRVLHLKKVKIVDKVVLGAETDYISHILKLKPKIIALGYDQKAYTKNLKELLSKKGLKPKIYRLKAHFPTKYKTSLLNNK